MKRTLGTHIDWAHEYRVDYVLRGVHRPRAWIRADVLRELYGRPGSLESRVKPGGHMDDHLAEDVPNDPVARVALERALDAVGEQPRKLRHYLVKRSRGVRGRVL